MHYINFPVTSAEFQHLKLTDCKEEKKDLTEKNGGRRKKNLADGESV